MDFNTLTPNLAYHFGFYIFERSLLDLVLGSSELDQVALTHSSGVKILPSIPLASQPRSLESGLDKIYDSDFDWIIVDTAPAQLHLLDPVLEHANLCLVVTEPELPSVAGCRRICRWLEQRGLDHGILVNKSRGESQELSIQEIEDSCDAAVLGRIPERAEVRRAVASGNPVILNNPYSPASMEFKRLSASWCGYRYPRVRLRPLRYLMARFRERRAPDLSLIPRLREHESKLSSKELEFFLASLEQQAKLGIIPQEIIEKIRDRLIQKCQLVKR